MFRWIVIFCAFLLLPFNAAYAENIAKDGLLKVDNWQYANNELYLVGDWQVIWGELVEPKDFDQRYEGDLFTMPGDWDSVEHTKMNGPFGVATFRLKLDLPAYEKALSILVVSPNSAWQFYLDGALLGGNGTVNKDPDKFIRHYIQRVFDAKAGKSEIVLQIANFANAHGGAQYAMALQDTQILRQKHDTMSLLFVLALGILLSVALIHMVFYLADRKHREQGAIHLWFSILCFLLVARVLGVIPFFHIYFPNFFYWSTLLIPYFTLYACPGVYLLFFNTAFPKQFPQKLTKAIIYFCLALAVLTLILPESYYTATKAFAILLNITVIIYSIIFTILAIRAKQSGAIVILASNFIFFLTALNDAVLHLSAGYGFDMTPFGIVILALGYSYALLLRLQNTFDDARDTSKALEVLNVELEQKVSYRTKAFKAAATKAENNALEKAQFIAAASHDLRQPLHALSMFNFALKRQITKPETTDLISKQSTAIKSLSTLLQDTLDVSKTESLKRKPKPSIIEISSLISDIVTSYNIRAKDQNLTLNCNSPEGQIFTDASMLQRILGNLVDNAIKAAKTFVKIEVTLADNNWVFQISDDGAGISQTDIHRIFDSYISLDNQEPNDIGGYGLGLYVVKEFTNLLGGSISVLKSSTKGSNFQLSLPNQQHGSPENTKKTKNTLAISQETQSLDLNILAIDDEPEVLDAMTYMLNSWGCNVKTATDKNQAMQIFKTGYMPDLLLVDFHLHGNDGTHLIAQLRSQFGQTIQAIIITGATQETILDKITLAGLNYLSKPIDADKLLIQLHKAKQDLL